ncbi:MAG TPA: TonB-dependent receptor [Agriterribacter sp.]|uniref:SusC/RagA family TonB-linked outer membrane protein n=1 Tax=Agriterribacter sp. TaxID=2821509 RepID=UPI002CE2082D|nr:TonB-dependent receptor [Agriterribacter sp.]HRQ18343.1 TonB-dependent receptor [Agriterribacter sp.]
MKKTKLLLYFTFFNILVTHAQHVVRGSVFDISGDPVSSVSVREKNTNNGILTDEEGKYQITVKSAQSILEFSMVGYKSQEIVAGSQASVDIVLELENSTLEDVVVIGYGTQKKVNLSGAVDQVKAKDLQNRPIANVSQGLQGMIPNLNIRFGSGAPGAAPDINIRGITSINGGGPLILVDGVQTSPTELNLLAAQDIESISVIKDASAAAIYGARAAFGVILITTKSGGTAGVKVSYSNNFSMNRPTVMPKMVTDPYIFSRLHQLSTDNTPWNNVNYSDQHYAYAKQRSEDPSVPGVRENLTQPGEWEYMGNRDWSRYFMDKYNFNQNHDLSVSGVSENNKVQYYLSGGYNRQNSPLALAKDVFDRYSLRAKVDYSINKWLKFGNNTFYTSSLRETPTYFDPWGIYNHFPTAYDKNPDGTWANTSVGYAAAQIVDGGTYTSKQNMIQSTFSGELSLWDRLLTVNADYTFRNTANNDNWHYKKYKIGYGPEDVREEGPSSAAHRGIFENYQIFNVYGTLNKSFSKHAFTAVLGYNQEALRYENFQASRQELISSSFPTIALATGILNANEFINSYAIRGVFGRLNYIFNDRYIVEFNGRYDGSSRFPQDKRFGFFPSASVAWRVDQENFMSSIHHIVNNFKIRASYGSLGNQSLGDIYYGYIPSMGTAQSGYLVGDGRPLIINPPALVSSNYTWEKVNTTNVGIDLGFLNDRITAVFDYYTRNTLDMLTLGKQLPAVLGAGEPMENAADLRTKGWELTLGYQDRFNVGGSPLSFNARFVLADSRSKITRFDNPNNSILQYYAGMELGEIWGLESDGLFQSTDEISKLDQTSIIPWGALSIVPGWPKYIDQDGNGIIEKAYTLGDTKDIKIIGNTTPRYQYGLDLSGNWKGVDVRVFLQGIGKRDYYPLDYLYFGFYQQPYGNTYQHLLDFYRPEDDNATLMAKHSQSFIDQGLARANHDAKFPILQNWLADANLGTRIDDAMGMVIPQTGYMLNAAYLRIKNVTVGYTLPESLTRRIGINRLRLYVAGENIHEWSELRGFFDPESTNGNIITNPTAGVGRSGHGMTYPFQRSYSAGINVIF